MTDAPPDLMEIFLEVDQRHHRWRLDQFIHARIPRLSRARVQQMVRSQEAMGGPRLRPSMRVHEGQRVVLLRPRPVEPEVPRHFEVLHEDPALVVIHKPAGLPIHATARFHKNTLVTLLRERYPGPNPPLPAHRLDRETSGIVLLGRGAAGAALKQSFRLRRVHKRYLAIVWGRPPETVVDLPLGPDVASGIRVKMGVIQGGQPARTRIRPLETRGEFSLVLAEPETGRQHQIRAHLHALGTPIVGDKLYGPDPNCLLEFIETGWTEELRQKLLLPRQALHAFAVDFPHPTTKEMWQMECPLPADLAAFWDGVSR